MKEFKTRRLFVLCFFAGIFIIFILRFFYLQVLDVSLKEAAENNAIRKKIVSPARGLVYDRNDNLVVSNKAVYDLMITPRLVKNLDTTNLCSLLKLSIDDFSEYTERAKKYSYYAPSVFLRSLDTETYLRFQEHIFKFKGFSLEKSLARNYHYSNGAHYLGYIGEVNKKEIKNSTGYYKMRDLIGKTGIEKKYESLLRGKKGIEFVKVDAFNREKGAANEGKNDVLPITGSRLDLTIDAELQDYGEQLLQNKIGSVIAIEPESGEILAMISSPSFNPEILNVRERGKNYEILLNDSLNPLYNRSTLASYIPGSIFKSVVSLIALQEGAIQKNTTFKCGGGYYIGRSRKQCSHDHEDAPNISIAIKESCNPYFWQTFKTLIDHKKYKNAEESLDVFSDYLYQFGLGKKLGIDLPSEGKGIIPTSKMYNRIYKNWRWKGSTIISLGIGQGEINITPMQMANVAAAIANKGYYITPHIVIPERSDSTNYKKYTTKNKIKIAKRHFEPVIHGMDITVREGTARFSKIEGIDMAGKTGTADNIKNKKPHSVYFGFAPVENPTIAIACVVENAGYGSTYAAPISSLMIEKYIKREIPKSRKKLEKRILEANTIKNPYKNSYQN